MRIQIIGINHGFQRIRDHLSYDFQVLQDILVERVIILIKEKQTELLSEEYSFEALDIYHDKKTILQQLSETNGIDHLFCDPNTNERALLRFASADEAPHRPREEEWLRRLKLKNVHNGSIIFLCGYDHVSSFCTLCINDGNDVLSEVIR